MLPAKIFRLPVIYKEIVAVPDDAIGLEAEEKSSSPIKRVSEISPLIDRRGWKSRVILMVPKDFGANCHSRHGSVYTATHPVTAFSLTRKNTHEN